MDFSKVDLIPILKSSMPCRFADMPPRDFELFVAQFFKDSGFAIEQIKHGSDYGVDVIVAKNGIRTAVQIKRYAEANKVGVPDINQALGGRNFYACDQVIFITTSDFTQPARRLAQETGVVLWNWNDFQKHLSDIYLGGKSFQEYFMDTKPAHSPAEPVGARVLRSEKTTMKGNYEGVLFYLALSNETTRNLEAQVLSATYITAENNQYDKRHFLEGYFVEGIIYAGCRVETCIVFDLAQLKRVRANDKIILTLLVEGIERSLMLKVEGPPSGQSNCFIATAAFGTDMADEVLTLKSYRDRCLKTTVVGRSG